VLNKSIRNLDYIDYVYWIVNRYVNGALFSHLDILISLFLPYLSFFRYSNKIVRVYNSFLKTLINNKKTGVEIFIKPYKGKNLKVLKIMDYLENHLKNDLLGAYVHGSLGTYEEIEYSDFDALLILEDKVFASSKTLYKVSLKLNSVSSIMYSFDPLQHHGWFILTESLLKCYPEYIFPLDLFRFSKSLFKDKGLKLNIYTQNSVEKSKERFYQLSNSIIKNLRKRDYLKNIYQFKILISQFMLLPALYVQARDGKGIFKKYSFKKAKIDFSEEDWSVMDDISTIRKLWYYKLSPVKQWLFTNNNQGLRHLGLKFAPFPPYKLITRFNNDLKKRMLNLVTKMEENISKK